MDILTNHVTIRKFTNRAISPELLELLLIAGTRAPNTGNMQWYSIVVTQGSNMLQKMAPLHFNQSAAVTAPLMLTICADTHRFNNWCKSRHANPSYDNLISFLSAVVDASLVAQNISIAAENSGLGVCYLGTALYNAAEIIELLRLPEHVVPVTTLAIGYPDESPPFTDRLPLDGVIHNEFYHDYSMDDINRIYSEKENNPLYKTFVEENQKENLAQVFTDVRYPKKNNEFFSEKLLDTLRKQDFLR